MQLQADKLGSEYLASSPSLRDHRLDKPSLISKRADLALMELQGCAIGWLLELRSVHKHRKSC